jgi:lipid A ethanolaminephosphotransferase
MLWVSFYNRRFWSEVWAASASHSLLDVLHIAVYGVVMTALYLVLLLPFINRITVKPLLVVLTLVAAVVSYFSSDFGVYVDTHMIDNVLQTDSREAGEWLTPGLGWHVLVYGFIPAWLIIRWPLHVSQWRYGVARSFVWLLGVSAVLGVSAMFAFQGAAALLRNHHEIRYLIAPANVIVSTSRVITQKLAVESEAETLIRRPVAEDAHLLDAPSSVPRLLVLVVGETVRAANWGLSGYSRNTTPLLAQQAMINFSDVSSCGTSTAVSLPCMFSLQNRRDFDARDAARQESILDVLARAGYDVRWVDNQSGCKGVCDGVTRLVINPEEYPALCRGEACLDGVLIDVLQQQIRSMTRDTVLVLHMMGNHGPSYYRRYPAEFRAFIPTCDTADLAQCSQQEITNAYDNALLYTDSVLNGLIDTLKQQSPLPSALLYLADHGESLGEHGVYLHGLPYAIAPTEQTRVPMVLWLSNVFQQVTGVTNSCMEQRASLPYSHDDLTHTLMGLLGVQSSVYDAQRDISRACNVSTR